MAIITVSREYGSEASPFGRALANSIGYSYVDKETILDMVRNHGKLRGKLEIKTTLSESETEIGFDESFIELSALEEKAIYEFALAEKAVIVGRGSNFLLKNVPYALHIRLVAPIDNRIANIRKHIDISPDQARNLARQSDLDRSKYVRTVYNQDWADPLAYDVVFDTTKHTDEEIFGQITNLAAKKDLLKTESEQLKLAKNAIAAKVKAAVTSSQEINISNLRVHFDDKAIIMQGIASNPNAKKFAEIIARTVAKGEPFVNKLRYDSYNNM